MRNFAGMVKIGIRVNFISNQRMGIGRSERNARTSIWGRRYISGVPKPVANESTSDHVPILDQESVKVPKVDDSLFVFWFVGHMDITISS